MKNFKIMCISVLLLGLIVGPAIAQDFGVDVLEPGNPPGGTCDIIGGPCDTCLDCAGGALDCINPQLKTFDDTWLLGNGETVEIDLWVTAVPEAEGLLTAGCLIEYDPSLVTITGIVPNDSNNCGPWDASEPFSPAEGQWLLQLLNFGCVERDEGNDIFMGRATLQSLTDGEAVVTLQTIGSGFDTIVGCAGTIYDPQVADRTITINPAPAGCDPPDCDDGNSCTVDVCNVDTCENTPDDSLCDDGDVCTGVETCDALDGCQAGTPLECDDGLYCNGAETCDAVSGCQDGIPPTCDDGIDCTTDECNQGSDACEYIPDDSECEDQNLCTINTCDPASGCQTVQVQCPAGQICDPETGDCIEEPCEVPEDCDDGLYCNGEEICDTGTGNCQAGTPPDCDDEVGCTDDMCDTGLDACVNTPNDGSCDDGDVCTGTETCDPVNDCQDGTPLVCDDGDLCTTDSCDAVDGCIFSPVECPEGQICEGGQCVVPPDCEINADCDDGVGCTEDTCDQGTCLNTPNDSSCIDDDLCTIDSCDPVNDCQNVPVECDPGQVCIEGECITSGECEVDQDCDDEVSCTVDVCDQGTCLNTPDSGLCDDEVACTVDTCDAVNDCQYTPSDGLCDDGNVCNGMETCDAIDDCQDGIPLNCDDGVYCTDDTCDEVAGCRSTPNDDNCQDDGLYCNGEELCDPVNNCYSTGDPCPSGTECNEDTQSCDSVGGLMVYVDIDPYTCPNPLNLESPYKVRVTILGTSDLDVEDIDPASLMLSREGVEGGVAIARVGGDGAVRYDYKDRSTPFEGKMCKCADCDMNGACKPDGYMDISGYFKISELVEGLKLYEVVGQRIPLTLTGMLKAEAGGIPLSGKDCVDVMGQCKGDFDCDGDVDGGDTDKLKKNFGWDTDDGSCDEKGICAGDLDKDGDIDSTDINAFKKVFGNIPMKGSPCGYEECAGDFDCDTDVDGQDAKKFQGDFGRSPLNAPCDEGELCKGDFDDDKDCDGTDAAKFKKDFGRSWLGNPCKGCMVQ